MADSIKVSVPEVLFKKNWDKAKAKDGLKVKLKSTGIGEELVKLAKLTPALDAEYKCSHGGATVQQKFMAEWPAVFEKNVVPVIKQLKVLEGVTAKAVSSLEKQTPVPKLVLQGAKDVLKTSLEFRLQLESLETEYPREMAKRLAEMLKQLVGPLKIVLAKAVTNVDESINEIKAYAQTPTEENFFKIFTGNSATRAYCTSVKAADQLLSKYPEIRMPVFGDAKLQETLLGVMQDYGASWSKVELEKHVNPKLGVGGEAVYKTHAKRLLLEVQKMQTFKANCQKVLNSY